MLFNGLYVLWDEPLIVSCFGASDRARFLDLRHQGTVLCFPAWFQDYSSLPSMIRDLLKARYRGKSLHFICNSFEEDRLRRRLGLPGALISQNAYISERVFHPIGVAKEFDAVYTAQMESFKRLNLAASVDSLFVVTYGETKTSDGEYDLHRFEPLLVNAQFNRRWISRDQINEIYNRSRVGLALSAVEGAMLAAVEYLLAGLPMVSTKCRGGRELFFDDRFVTVVEPTPGAVATGVTELIRREIDPALVREATMTRVMQHRQKLCEYVRDIIIRTGTANVPSETTLYERVFGGPDGTRSCYVPSRDFAARGW